MNYYEPLVPLLVETVTDWNVLIASLAVGVISATATIIAVWYTNKKTRELYEETRAEEKKQNAMSLIAPSLRYATFFNIREKLLLDGNDERMLLLSSKKDGFGFYDDEAREDEVHCIFSICNEGENRIEHINITTSTVLIAANEAEKLSESVNYVKILRKNERVFIRVHSDEQRQVLLEGMGKRETIKTEFNCTINYLTTAGQQICYKYNIAVTDIPKTDDKGLTTYRRKPEIINDEYSPINNVSIDRNALASSFRDLQENLTFDGFGYKYRRIGDEQMKGTLKALKRFFEEQGITEAVKQATDSVSNIDKSMQNMSGTFTYLESLAKLNRETLAQIEANDDTEENGANET